MSIRSKLLWYKDMLIDHWNIGAEQGKELKKKHYEKIKIVRRKEK